MMATTYKIIDKVELTGTQTSITFTGLGSYSSDYTDLLVCFEARSNAGGNNTVDITFNSNTSSYSSIYLYGNGSSPASGSNFGRWAGSTNDSLQTANCYSNSQVYIPNFSSSNYKTYSTDSVFENNGTFAHTVFVAGLWSNTAAITSIALQPYTGDFISGSTFWIYGIKNS